MKIALITGITGQDGQHLTQFLLAKDYEVFGFLYDIEKVRNSQFAIRFPEVKLIQGDLASITSVIEAINFAKPDEIYNLGAMSHVAVSFQIPEYTTDIDSLGTLRLLEAIKNTGKKIKFYQASTSELYGGVYDQPQNEETPFHPRSPYAIAKQYAFWITKNYRESYSMFAVNGILFNHGGIRRGHNFVERKITLGLGKIIRGETDRLVMGNIDAKRDIGNAVDYVEGMWMMLQHDVPGDYVLATGETHTIREMIEKAFARCGFEIRWEGCGINEVGYNAKTGQAMIFISDKYYRPTEVDVLQGDATKAMVTLGWEPKTTFDELINMMVDYDTRYMYTIL